MWGFYTGHPGGYEGTSLSTDNIYDLINIQEKAIMAGRGHTESDIKIKQFSIKSVGTDNRIRFNGGSWMFLTADEYLSLEDVGSVSIELQTDAIDYIIGFSF